MQVTANLYDRLFKVENPDAGDRDFKEHINPDSLCVLSKVFVEPDLKNAKQDVHYQFIRKGYFILDKDAAPGNLIFNRAVTLKDSWAKSLQ